MSDAEGLMWRLENDPHLSSTFASISILDRKPDIAALRRRLERASVLIPRLRQRVMPAPANLTSPVWVDDPDFDLNTHVRHIALPKPGTMRQLLDLATLIVADPFDRSRPLWQFYVIEGLRGGKSALVQKTHHTITDGEGGVELAMHFLDIDRDAPEPALLDPATDASARQPHPNGGANDLTGLVAGGLRLPLGVVRQVRDLLADPTGIPDAGHAAATTLKGIVSQLSDTEPARSPLWTRRSLRRHVEVTKTPFRATKEAATRLGGTLNTAFLTAAAHAASRYHIELGRPVESLRTSMAVSTRTAESGSNAFSLVRLLVPTGDMPIGERFAAIHETVSVAREPSAAARLDTLATMSAALPTSVITRLARQQSQTVDFATSNVKGSPVPVYVAGAKMLATYPIGPLAGVAFNLTLLSYDGHLDMAMHIDPAAVEHPDLLQMRLVAAFKELVKA